MEKIEVLNGFFNGLINNTNIRGYFSPFFVLDEGMNLDEFMSKEINTFTQLSSKFKINNNFCIYVNSFGLNWLDISFINENKEVIYEWVYFFDKNNLIVGNASKIQSISKLQFTIGEDKPLRSLAIESKVPITAIVVKNKIIDFSEITSLSNDNEFFNYIFEIKNDCFKTEWMDFVFYGQGFKECKNILMTGIDRVGFNESYPIIKDNVILLKNNLIWCINIWFEDESSLFLLSPSDNELNFEKKIKKCIVTDTLDNDWVIDID